MEVLIDNRDGVIWKEAVKSFSWKTERIGKAGAASAEFVLPPGSNHAIVNGAVMRVTEGKYNIFYGYVQSSIVDESNVLKVEALDQLRYLKFNDTFVLSAMTGTAAIKKICSAAGLKIGTMEDTGVVIPAVVKDDQDAFDVVTSYLDQTLIASNRIFVLYDEFGSIALRKASSLYIKPTNWYLGDESLLYEYEFKKSIESDTYNVIKLVKDDDKTGKREIFQTQDASNISKWGLLQYFEKVDANATSAEIKAYMNQLLAVKNQESKTFTMRCLGRWAVRAGSYVHVHVKKLDISQPYLVEQCEHNWDGGVHTMNLTLKVVS